MRLRIAALGAHTGPGVSGPSELLFKPLHEAAPALARIVERDLHYGPHPRHRLDVHRPATAGGTRPVLLFIHGGGFVKGDKTVPGSFFYDNVAGWAVRCGFVAVNMTYRLAPAFRWPSGGDDVGLALRWVAAHIASRGGNSNAIFLFGHSAGAAHAATWLARAEAQGDGAAGLAGCILLSGSYDPSVGTPRAEYYGTDVAAHARQSTVQGLVRSKVPLLLGMAEYDPPDVARQTTGLLAAFGSSGAALPRVVQAEGHNHYTITHHLGTPDDRLGTELARFVARHAAPPARHPLSIVGEEPL